jgi:hypothetical protein
MTSEEIARLRTLAEKAWPGPWITRDEQDSFWGFMIDGPADAGTCATACTAADAAFISAARTALPALLDEVARLRVAVYGPRDMTSDETPEQMIRRLRLERDRYNQEHTELMSSGYRTPEEYDQVCAERDAAFEEVERARSRAVDAEERVTARAALVKATEALTRIKNGAGSNIVGILRRTEPQDHEFDGIYRIASEALAVLEKS